MADLSDLESAQTVKIVGSDLTGVEISPVSSDTAGNLSVRLRDGTGAALGTSTNQVVTYQTDSPKDTYSAAVVGLVAATTTPTDVLTISGSATKRIRVTRIAFSMSATTAAQRDVVIIKRSTANTGGTSTSPAGVAHNSTSAVASAVVRAYTANPTALGTSLGIIRSAKVTTNLPAGSADRWIIDFGTRASQAIVLNGTAESIAINFNSVASAGPLVDVSIEWTEE